MLKKQAKTLNDQQIKAVIGTLATSGRNHLRNKVIFLLSLHGLRAKEIADLEVSMIVDAEGQLAEAIHLTDAASKGKSGRVVPMNKQLREAVRGYLDSKQSSSFYVVSSERQEKFTANAITVLFHRLYASLGFKGASSHSGRRTFITNCARKVSQVGGSLRDVMALAGHQNLSTTQRYIDQDPEAQRMLINSLYRQN